METQSDKKIEEEFSSKTLVRTRKWTIEIKDYEDGSSLLTRINEGFSAIELLGYIYKAQQEILAQISGDLKPTKTIRKIIKNK